MTHTIRKSITLNVEPVRVWDALTHPAITRQYFYNCEVLCDWIIGHPIVYRETTRTAIIDHIKGTLIGFVPRQMLAYTYPARNSREVITVAIYIMLDKDRETEVTIVQDCGNDEETYHRAMTGWDQVLDGLKFVIEK
jgi:uncharacterized protein YndB with AHSA1/START domain